MVASLCCLPHLQEMAENKEKGETEMYQNPLHCPYLHPLRVSEVQCLSQSLQEIWAVLEMSPLSSLRVRMTLYTCFRGNIMNSTQASWRKRKLLEMSNFKISSSQGSGMFSPGLTRTGTVWRLCTGLRHRRESSSGSHGSHGWTERLCLTDWGPRSCRRWGRPASSTTCLPNHGIHFLSQISRGFSENYRCPSVDCFPMYFSVWIRTAPGVPLSTDLSLSHTYT